MRYTLLLDAYDFSRCQQVLLERFMIEPEKTSFKF